MAPQVLLNVEVRSKPRLQSEFEIIESIKAAEEKLGANGRVLVRYSGTEPLLRIMVEGPNVAVVEELADKIVSEHGQADIITSNNVFANIDDIHEWMKSVKKLLSPKGVYIFESFFYYYDSFL